MSHAPTKPGFYWAKWMIVDDAVDQSLTPYRTWEPVEVYWNDDDELRVWMCGHAFNQGVDCFHWGAPLEPPVDKVQVMEKDAEREKLDAAFARYRAMTPEQRYEFLQVGKRK